MQSLFKLLASKLKSMPLFHEIRQITLLVLLLLIVRFVYVHGSAIVHILASRTGMVYLTFTMLSVVLALAIRIFFRIVVIKYAEKDIRIKLFEGL